MMHRMLLAIAAIAVSFLFVTDSYARDWVRLGERHVGFINDHDTITVGRYEGRFKRIKLIVHHNDIELSSVKIVFGNGKIEDVEFHQKIRAGGSSPAIDLRTPWHDGRAIREIRIHYRTKLNFKGEAVVEVWGQED
jgi:hypothetical protein